MRICCGCLAGLVAFLVTACSGITYGPSKPDPDTEFSPNVFNAKDAFVDFWQVASQASFERQVELWDDRVETKYHRFYDSAVYQKQRNPQWEQQKQAKLRRFFAGLPRLYEGMLAEFSRFDGLLAAQLAKFKTTFPDASFKGLDVFAAPSLLSFSSHGDTYLDEPKSELLGFGMDRIYRDKDDTDVLYPHELFHAYHSRAMGLSVENIENQGSLLDLLWLEGVAVYVSGMFNPGKSDAALLMDSGLAKTCAPKLPELARRFLKIATTSMATAQENGIYGKWFGNPPSVDKHIPKGAGFCLGLAVARKLAGTQELKQMVKWKLPEIESNVLGALRAMK
ncbi:MAG: hypothetical protein HY074_01945 [Deltaproteobacteria bacterium]|nr:hypothetical protein [Deltaproteobacteria bacterium]